MPTGIYKRTKRWKWPEESKLKIIGNQNFHPPERDYKMTEKHREGIRKSWQRLSEEEKMKRIHNFAYSKTSGFTGHHHTKIAKRKQCEATLRYFENFHQKREETFPEKIMEAIINDWIKMKIFDGYLSQFRIGRYIVDFLLIKRQPFEKKVVVEVYGEHWHSGFAKKYKDMRRKEYLEKRGYEVKIFYAKKVFKFRDSNGRKFTFIRG